MLRFMLQKSYTWLRDFYKVNMKLDGSYLSVDVKRLEIRQVLLRFLCEKMNCPAISRGLATYK